MSDPEREVYDRWRETVNAPRAYDVWLAALDAKLPCGHPLACLIKQQAHPLRGESCRHIEYVCSFCEATKGDGK